MHLSGNERVSWFQLEQGLMTKGVYTFKVSSVNRQYEFFVTRIRIEEPINLKSCFFGQWN